MEKPVILSIMLITVIGATGFVACDVFTKSVSGGLIKEMGQTNYSKHARLVNVTLSVERNDQLLKLIKKMLHRRQMNETTVPEIVTGSNHTNRLRRKKSTTKRQRTRRRNGEPVFDANTHIKRTEKGIMTICGRVNCDVGYYAKPCVRNYTSDVCTPCPPGTYLWDPTKSEVHVIKCVPKHHCSHWPGTVHTQEMHACAGDYRMACRCDTESGICGLDPCNCRKHKCYHDESLLQNCSCIPKATTTVIVTHAQSNPTSSPKPISTTTFPSPVTTTSTPPDLALSTTSAIDQVTSTSNSANMKIYDNSGDRISWKTVGATVGIMIPTILVVVFLYIHRQQILDQLPPSITNRYSQFFRVPQGRL